MEDDDYVRKLPELIFSEQFKNIEEMTSQDSSITTCLLTNDISRKIHSILYIKQMIFESEWQEIVYLSSDIISYSFELYLRTVMYACLTEYESNQNIFESFISVCAIFKRMNDGIFDINGIDVSKLNNDAFMVFYDSVVKNTFSKHGGFRRFIEYINDHRYLMWKWNWKDVASFEDFTHVKIPKDTKKKIKKEIRSRPYKMTDAEKHFKDEVSIFLTEKILSTTPASIVPSNLKVIKCLETSKTGEIEKAERERIVETTERSVELDVTHRGFSSSNSDARTDHAATQNGYNTQYENIIQAAIRHNHSRSSDHTNSNNHIQMEAKRILDHLKDTVKSLIIVLDEFEKE